MHRAAPSFGRRHFLASAAVGVIAAGFPLTSAKAATVVPPSSSSAETVAPAASTPAPASAMTMLQSTSSAMAAPDQSVDSSIRPFHFRASDDELADLKRRIKATRWPDRETVNDDTQGVQLATTKKLADYWANHHDWRRAEAHLFSYPHFVTDIDGIGIHFIHVKSKHANARPLVLTHGWPGSVVEFLNVIGPLTDPTAAAKPRTHSTSLYPRYRATAFPTNRRSPAGACRGSREHGRS